ncbi:MAG: undecaprenyl-phosphate glucose phosphotransferase [Woeseiaceae bacterium]|nr:undecaprenyl-phosphate glucose phosphotransferase [Gammaproteobacteria bacterium]NNK25325.1 undecaprenyl-phosphate glucose phosphotransferase [Woeseiaceae bacterium]
MAAARGPKLRSGSRMFSESITSGLVALGDAFLVLVSGLLICLYYVQPVPGELPRYVTVLLIIAYMLVQSFYIAGLYRFSAISKPSRQIGKITSISTIIFLLVVAAAYALKASDQFSRVWLFSTAIVSVGLISLARAATVTILRRLAANGRLVKNIMIYGTGEQAERFIANLRQMDEPWNRVVGVFDDRQRDVDEDQDIIGTPFLGDLDDMIRRAREVYADDIVVALPWNATTRIWEVLHALRILPANIRLAPEPSWLGLLSRRIDYQYNVPLASVFDKPLSGWRAVIKRVFDVVVTSLTLLLLSPLLLTLMLWVKLDSRGPVFFRQKRYGFNNEVFDVWKLRTMYVDQQDADAEKLATVDDPRVTRAGRFLRRSSLDELPQLLNVLVGDMSLVGPRPHALKAKAGDELYQDAVGEYAARHKVRPGITGWAQVNGWRGETDTREKILKRVEHDLYYIDNWSVWLDLKILLRTLPALLSQENAY